MAANMDQTYWYGAAFNVCFDPAAKISKNSFLVIFSAIMTGPSNSNYRYATRTADEVWEDQKQLLKEYIAQVEQWSPHALCCKDRVVDLADCLKTRTGLNAVEMYASKHSNYKARHYINYYLMAADGERKRCYDELSMFYGLVLEKIFDGDLEDRIRQMEELLSRKIPEYQIGSCPDNVSRIGQYMSALMLCCAAQDVGSSQAKELIPQLLGVSLPESCATQSVFSLDHVDVDMGQFAVICSAAMRADLDIDELTAIYRNLYAIREKMGGQSDPRLHTLLGELANKLNAFGQQKSRSIADNWSSKEKELEEIRIARGMYQTCLSWIE